MPVRRDTKPSSQQGQARPQRRRARPATAAVGNLGHRNLIDQHGNYRGSRTQDAGMNTFQLSMTGSVAQERPLGVPSAQGPDDALQFVHYTPPQQSQETFATSSAGNPRSLKSGPLAAQSTVTEFGK